jgi:hypothetical protein
MLPEKTTSRLDKPGPGLLTGILLPFIVFSVYTIFIQGAGVCEMLVRYYERHVLSHVVSLSVIANLGLFFLYLRFNLERAARGVLFSMFLYGFLIVLLKFIL